MKSRFLVVLIITFIGVNLLPDTLINEYRLPLQIVTWSTGRVLDDEGNGFTTTPLTDPDYSYIKYNKGRCTASVFTIYIMNPLSCYSDDIIGRLDFYK